MYRYYQERLYLAAEPNGLATSWDPPTNFAKLENSPNWLKNPHRLWLENKIRAPGGRPGTAAGHARPVAAGQGHAATAHAQGRHQLAGRALHRR